MQICGQLFASLVVVQSLNYVQLFGPNELQHTRFPSQEAGKMIWQCHLFYSFPQFAVIHTVEGFSTVNEAEVDFSWEFSCFFYDLMGVGNLIFGSSTFSKPIGTSRNSWFMCCQYFSFTFAGFSLTRWLLGNLFQKKGIILQSGLLLISLGWTNSLSQLNILILILWCWRRLLRVLWTARRPNQSILKEISSGSSMEGLMLKLKLQYFGHLM